MNNEEPTGEGLPRDDKSVGPVAPTNDDNSTPAPLQTARPKPQIAGTRRLDVADFPDQPAAGESLKSTIPNVMHLLYANGIYPQYDVIKKRVRISILDQPSTRENVDNVTMAQIVSLMAAHGLSTGLVYPYVDAIAEQNAYNPAENWIRQQPWDRVDRLQEFYSTVTEREGYPPELKAVLLYKWLLSAVAAALLPHGFRSRGVLTLQGPQGIGKTSWGRALVSDPVLRDGLVKVDHHMDGGNKDSLLIAISHWICELGELESSFKKDIPRLKGFLTSDYDKVRRPYARIEAEYPRRTVFFATVNENNFLIDGTGNSRWWTIPVTKLDYEHTIDMQQVFAQLAVDLDDGKKWWLTPEEEEQLNALNTYHRSISVIRERLMEIIELEPDTYSETKALTCTELLQLAGFDRPTNAQAKECGSILRDLLGDPKRINGRDKWRVPLLRGAAPSLSPPARDKYD